MHEQYPYHAGHGHADEMVECPNCGEPSDSIKCYSTMILVFLWIFVFWQPKKDVGCQSCIRGKIAFFCIINILTANILWPIIILPWTIVLVCMSFTRGHSSEIAQILRNPPRREQW